MKIKRRSLAGKCGIPTEGERVYLEAEPDDPRAPIQRIGVPGGKSWKVEASSVQREMGRAEFGNLCIALRLTIRGRHRNVWWEDGRWFGKKRTDRRQTAGKEGMADLPARLV